MCFFSMLLCSHGRCLHKSLSGVISMSESPSHADLILSIELTFRLRVEGKGESPSVVSCQTVRQNLCGLFPFCWEKWLMNEKDFKGSRPQQQLPAERRMILLYVMGGNICVLLHRFLYWERKTLCLSLIICMGVHAALTPMSLFVCRLWYQAPQPCCSSCSQPPITM